MNKINFIDIHTHKNCNSGYTCIMNLFAHNPVSEGLNERKFYSIGLHPWHINKDSIQHFEKTIRDSLIHPGIIAIGECGLDFACDIEIEIQDDVFRRQAAISEESALPIILHCVKTYNEIIRHRKELNPTQPWILHGYNGNPQTTEQLLKYDFYFSFGEILTNAPAKVVESLKVIPQERIFLETDESDMNIENIYNSYSNISGIKTEQIKATIRNNFEKCFGKQF